MHAARLTLAWLKPRSGSLEVVAIRAESDLLGGRIAAQNVGLLVWAVEAQEVADVANGIAISERWREPPSLLTQLLPAVVARSSRAPSGSTVCLKSCCCCCCCPPFSRASVSVLQLMVLRFTIVPCTAGPC